MQRMERNDYLEGLRNYAWDKVEPELLEDNKAVWNLDRGDRHPWRYLKAESQVAHMQFHGWVQVIREDLKCDERACSSFQRLFRTNPVGAPYGFMEANRVLAHVLKDKMKPEDAWRPGRDDWSRYLQKACDESIEALEHWRDVKSLRLEQKGPSAWCSQQVPAPGDPADSGDDPKGKGKGKYLQRGQR